ncbi:MAG TPA: hypothetical protein H9816_04005 [Candidatus Tidjanibacter faecipullorum]|uniref:Uncharacterized protein n=1 Tax=Candidatus Tidjanibacter faecipullorum TaxID=2838766 RepID=A0A9D2DDK6_9BACT|nr:hypothetical protein [Candidatus Tidjanibacter faecipullorum]
MAWGYLATLLLSALASVELVIRREEKGQAAQQQKRWGMAVVSGCKCRHFDQAINAQKYLKNGMGRWL